MAPHSSTLAWKIPWTEEPGRIQSMESRRVGQESDTTEWLHFHFSLSCIGEGNATHSSVLAWRISGTEWAAVYEVTQSWTWLKQLNSSSSCNDENLETTQMLKSQRIGKQIINLYNGILLNSEKKYLQQHEWIS